MCDATTPPEEPGATIEVVAEAVSEPEVAFIVPAEPYGSIVTDEIATPVESSPVPPEAPEILAALRDFGTVLGKRLDGLQAAFDREIRAEATREKVVDRLHAELQEYKQDLLLNILRPVFVDLIQLHDDIGKIVANWGTPDGETGRLLDLMSGFQQGIEDILYRQGVEPFHVEEATFDPRRQRAVATVTTDDEAQARTVAVRHRKGFQAGARVIRPEIVSVYAIKK
jgi:molecular chaperone GrpE